MISRLHFFGELSRPGSSPRRVIRLDFLVGLSADILCLVSRMPRHSGGVQLNTPASHPAGGKLKSQRTSDRESERRAGLTQRAGDLELLACEQRRITASVGGQVITRLKPPPGEDGRHGCDRSRPHQLGCW
jgi:hypothetical protein